MLFTVHVDEIQIHEMFKRIVHDVFYVLSWDFIGAKLHLFDESVANVSRLTKQQARLILCFLSYET